MTPLRNNDSSSPASSGGSPASDEERLILRAQRGDQAAFETLYLNHLDAIYRYTFFRIGDTHEAEDMTEEVFVRAWEQLPGYRIGATRFASWLYRMAHNMTVDYYRKRPADSLSEPRLARMAAGERTEEMADTRQTSDALAQAVRKLDEVEQMVIILRFVEGLSHQETAATIGKSLEASRVIQHRALAKLGGLLEDQG